MLRGTRPWINSEALPDFRPDRIQDLKVLQLSAQLRDRLPRFVKPFAGPIVKIREAIVQLVG